MTLALSRRTLLAYGGFALPLSLAEIPILLYLPAFYAKEVGLSPGLVGLAFLLARLWDGVADLLTGWLSDRSSFRFGRRKPWVVAGAPLLMLATWFLCNPPDNAGFLYLVLWAPLFYAADAVVKIPYLSWGSELTTDYVERSRVTAFRETFLMLGSLCFVAAPLLFLPAGAPLSDILLLISTATLAIVPLTVIPLGALVPDRAAGGSRTPSPLFTGLAALAKDRVLLVFAAAMLLYSTASGVSNSLAVFSFGVGLQLRDKLLWIIFIYYIATLCTVPLLVRLFKHGEKHRLYALAALILSVANCAHLFVPAGNFPLVIGLWILAGLGNAAALILPTSILADIIDHGEVISGERRAGVYMAVFNLVKKIGLALGVGLSFGLLQLVGYDPSAAEHGPADVLNIRVLGFVLPGLLFASTIIFIWKHPVTRQVQQQLRERIDAGGEIRSGVRPEVC